MEVREPSAKYLAKAAYKQTEVGVIPEDWEVDSLANFWSVTDCKHVTAQFVSNGYPLASIKEVQSRFVDLTDAKHTTLRFYNLLTEGGRKPRIGDLILSRNATVGEVAQVAEWHPPFAMGQDVVLLRKRVPEFSTNYLQAVIRSSVVANQLSDLMVGSTFKRANVKQIKGFTVPMPPASEQQAIAEALSDADALIEALEQLLAKKRQIKQGAMQELLTGQKRLPGFAGEWENTTLGAIAERIVGGGTPSRNNLLYWNGRIPWMTVKDFATFSPFGTLEYITRAGLEGSASNLIPSGTLITSTRMAIGKAVIFEVDVCINQDLKAIYLRKDIDPRFLYFWFQFNERRIAELGSGSTVMGISLPELMKIRFFKPEHDEQTAIATLLSDMDAEIAALEAKLGKARGVKQGMMQELLTGRIRLV